jgi:hypothetical protein
MLMSKRYVKCTHNTGYPASLTAGKKYEVVPDADADKHSMIRVVDNSGDNYLFDAGRFVAVTSCGSPL